MGFNFTIEYKKGKENFAADALSRICEPQPVEDAVLARLTFPTLLWLDELKCNYNADVETKALLTKLKQYQDIPNGYTLLSGLILKKDKILVVAYSPFKEKLFHYVHNDSQFGHLGFLKTYQRTKKVLLGGNEKRYQKDYSKCEVRQVNKHETVLTSRLLQPLAIPKQTWSQIAMDFIEGLPLSNGYTTIMVVVYRFTKHGHFIPLDHHFTAQQVAYAFLSKVFKLHKLPNNIVSDRDPLFMSNFWQSFFTL